MLHTQIILGKVVARPATMDQALARTLLEMGKYHDFTTVTGKTMCCDDFYEGQGRLDGAICNKVTYITTLTTESGRSQMICRRAFSVLFHYLHPFFQASTRRRKRWPSSSVSTRPA